MQRLKTILRTGPRSEIAKALRLSLYGLRAALQKVIDDVEDASADLAYEEGKWLLDDLDDLLAQSEPAWASNREEIAEPLDGEPLQPGPAASTDTVYGIRPAIAVPKLKLWPVCEAFYAEPNLKQFLGDVQLQSTTDNDLWFEINCLLLRVPQREAFAFRQRALRLASEAGAYEDASNALELPSNEDVTVWPGLSSAVEAKGLRCSKTAPLDDLLGELSPQEEGWFLASLVTICLAFIDLDSHLHLALRSINQFSVSRFDLRGRASYRKELVERFKRVRELEEKGAEPDARLLAMLDLSEAINSLVYLPPCDSESSWWGRLRQEMRASLEAAAAKARSAGVSVNLRWLSGPYASIHDLTSHSLTLDEGGIAGEVLKCLRPFAQINGKAHQGRVLYRRRC